MRVGQLPPSEPSRRDAVLGGLTTLTAAALLGRTASLTSWPEPETREPSLPNGPIQSEPPFFVTPEQFGAIGDGTTDDTLAVQAALDTRLPVLATRKYFLSSQGVAMGGEVPWHRYITVPSGARVGGGGEFRYKVGYEERGVIFSLLGSNITFEGVRFRNTVDDATQPWSIAIGMSPSREELLEPGAYRNIALRGCEFYHDFSFASFDFDPSRRTLDASLDGVIIDSCVGYGHPFAAKSAGTGCFDGHHIGGLSYTGNWVDGGTFASTYNMVNVGGGVITGNFARNNEYAGAQIENGSTNIVVSGNTFIDCRYGIWVDDSAFVAISGNSISGKEARLGIFVSREGFSGNESFSTTAISITGNVLQGCPIYSGSFGSRGGGAFGTLTIVGNVIDAAEDGAECMNLAASESMMLMSNTCTGGARATIELHTAAGQSTLVSGNATSGSGLGISVVGDLGTRLINGNMVLNPTWRVSGTLVANFVGGSRVADE